MITLDALKKIIPFAGPRAGVFFEPLRDSMQVFEINTPLREAAFLAQVAHESGSLRYTREIGSGKAYEGRVDLGNTEPGDGPRYKGRGLIQITGRANYAECSKALFGDQKTLLDYPEMLETVSMASQSAAWWWFDHGLNERADKGAFRTITRIINGGYNGFPDRLAFYERAKQVIV